MTSTTHTVAGSPSVERFIALSTTFAPVVVGAAAPYLTSGAAFTVGAAYCCVAGITVSNYTRKLSDHVLDNLPAGDIFRAHVSPMFLSTATTGLALALGVFGGIDSTETLMAGFLGGPSVNGFISLAWWGAVSLVPFKLRKILWPSTLNTGVNKTERSETEEEERILHAWSSSLPDHELNQVRIGDSFWSGVVRRVDRKPSRVTVDTVSAIYRVPADWVSLTKGGDAGEQLLRVNLVAPEQRPEPSTLEERWARVARSGGVLPGSYLTEVQPDENTGGTLARVNVGKDEDCLPATVDRRRLAGALRKSALLVSYEPAGEIKAVIRIMDKNPLEKGTPLLSRDQLLMDKAGKVKIGKAVSGHPARLPLIDPVLGAQHVLIAGVSGSGKSGAVQLVALAAHVNGGVLIYGDPKGGNKAVTLMAAHSGEGDEESMGSLRVAHAVYKHRTVEAKRLGLKNFTHSPERPWVVTILDEASTLLGPTSKYRKEATAIADDLASKGRSLGMSLVLVNQTVNADELGGSTKLRSNLIGAGSWLMLRCDSSQKNLADVPTAFAGISPADIPDAWPVERAMVYNESVPDNDPTKTFGLGYMAAPGGVPELARTLMLESAEEFIDYDSIAVPRDFPDWDRRMELIAKAADTESDTEGEAIGGVVSVDKPQTTEERVLWALEMKGASSPLGTVYVTKDELRAALPDVNDRTLSNTLTEMKGAGKVHTGQRGSYGLGPAPE